MLSELSIKVKASHSLQLSLKSPGNRQVQEKSPRSRHHSSRLAPISRRLLPAPSRGPALSNMGDSLPHNRHPKPGEESTARRARAERAFDSHRSYQRSSVRISRQALQSPFESLRLRVVHEPNLRKLHPAPLRPQRKQRASG
jgi:hypothetical protein